jgi:two-component system nitrogen regulation sensor histidine kinase GlnL
MSSPQSTPAKPSGAALQLLKSAAFDLSPAPALVVDGDGALVAVNEAAEALFGQGLSLLARGRFRAALPAGSALVSLLSRALKEGAPVREHDVEISLFGHPPFHADGAAAPLGDGSVLLTLHVRGGALAPERVADAAGLRSVVGLGRMRPMRSRTRWPASAARHSCSRPVRRRMTPPWPS